MNTETIITLRSVTFAIRAKRLLEANGIRARVVKPEPTSAEHGCAYGVSVMSHLADSALVLLRQNRINAALRR